MRISDWSSDVCSSDLRARGLFHGRRPCVSTAPRRTWVIEIMRRFFPNRGLAAALAIILSTTTLSAARADTADYEFRLVQTDVKQGDGAVVAVRLVAKRSGAAIPDAVIFATRIAMAPEGLPPLTAPTAARSEDRRVGREC